MKKKYLYILLSSIILILSIFLADFNNIFPIYGKKQKNSTVLKNNTSIANSVMSSNLIKISNVSMKNSSISNTSLVDFKKLKLDALPILMYHAIDDNIFGQKELFIHTEMFAKQMKYLHDNGYTTLSFDEIKDYNKYKKPIIITFDDGYMDNYTNAYPVLKKYNFKATIFVATKYLGSPSFLTIEQVKKMTDIISFESHTVSHAMLTKLPNNILNNECIESKNQIEKITGKSVIAIAYPSGMYNGTVTKVVKKYYTYGINSKFGYYKTTIGNYDIKRIGVSYLDTIDDFIKKI